MIRRDRFIAIWLFLLYIVTWVTSMSSEFQTRFWDRGYNLQRVAEPKEEYEYGFNEITKTYYSDLRYVWFVPHVVGAVFWWNLYFLQLIPKVRHWKDKKFHRMLGRFLMIILLLQNITGFALATSSHSNVAKLISYILCCATIVCIAQAWRYAYYRDIPKHKYWVIRLVGYMHTLSLQRLWLGMLIVSHVMGWYGLYPQMEDDAAGEEWAELASRMADGSSILSITTAILVTEWYLSTEQGMTAPAIDNRKPSQETVRGSDQVEHGVNHSFHRRTEDAAEGGPASNSDSASKAESA